MPYVNPEDSEDEEDLESSAASELLADDDDENDDDGVVDAAIRNDAKELTEHARGEVGLLAGIHVWAGVKDALEVTFPGWPDNSADYDRFRGAVEAAFISIKRKDEEFVMELFSRNPFVDQCFKKFMTCDTPLQKPGKKLHWQRAILKIMVRGVKYLAAERRQKYEVTLGATLMRSDAIFDTKVLFNRKKATAVPGSQVSSKLEKKERCIWVMTLNDRKEATFYSHFGKLGRFHHSSFTGGSPVVAAGEWYVERGKCLLINACSGHYKPEPWRFLRAYKELNDAHAITDQTVIQVWHTWSTPHVEEHKPLIQFIQETRNFRSLGPYQLHPG
jgi:hypothetical protein